MGGSSSSSSKAKQKSKTNVVNQSDMNLLNQTLNSTVVNAVIKNVQSCSASLIAKQNLVVSNLHAKGDLNINAKQSQAAALNFSCAQNAQVQNTVLQTLTNQLTAQLQTNFNTDTLNQFNATADSLAKADFGSTGKADSKSKTDQSTKTDISNTINTNLENIITNTVKSNFTNETYNSCLAKVISTQNAIFTNLSGVKVNFTFDQEQAIQVYSKCIQESGVSASITNSLANTLGVTVINDVATTTKNNLTGNATSEATSGGPLQAVGDLISAPIDALLSPLNNLLDSFGLSSLSGYLQPLVGMAGASSVCCCVVIIIIVIVMLIK